MSSQSKKVLVGMSGKMGSSVTAGLLKQQGYEVHGLHLRFRSEKDKDLAEFKSRCCASDQSEAQVKKLCSRLDIPLHILDVSEPFRDRVVDYFVHEYLQQRKPNPCIPCNKKIKFHYLFQKADELGCEWVATGHYARIVQDLMTGHAHLLRSGDPLKDQSYFLFELDTKLMARVLTPLGNFTETMVKKLAIQFDMDIGGEGDPREICFVGSDRHSKFIEQQVAVSFLSDGLVQNETGVTLGQHKGFYRLSYWQTTGFTASMKEPESTPGEKKEVQKPFVFGFDRTRNVLIVSNDESAMYSKALIATRATWIRKPDAIRGTRCKAKVSPMHDEAQCWVTLFENDMIQVVFDEPQKIITPGQAVVFYEGEEVLGGAYILKTGIVPAAPTSRHRKEKKAEDGGQKAPT